jgi:hypothetical protein
LLGALLAVAGCREPPSWAARWRLADRNDPEAEPEVLTDGEQCSSVGVSQIDFFTVLPFLDRGGISLDIRSKPCWAQAMENPNRTLGGPAVPPGEYDLVAIGLGTDGQRWCNPGFFHNCNPGYVEEKERPFPPPCGDGFVPSVDVETRTYGDCVEEATCDYCGDYGWAPTCEPDGGCHPSFHSCDCTTFTAVEDETVQIRDLVIAPPPECEDGIDEDGDGLVDERDPGCQSTFQREDIDVIATQLIVDLSLLSNNPSATCAGVGLSRFDISLDGRVLSSPACDVGEVSIALEIAAGIHEVAVIGLAPDGMPLTREKVFTVEALAAGVLVPQLLEVDFADTDFIDPIRSPAQFAVGYEAPEGLPTRFCSGAPGLLDIAEVSIRMVDAVGNPVEPAPLIEHGELPLPGMRLDGSPLPCTAQAIITAPLRWGVYRVEVEAFSAAGDVCFTNLDEPALLAPGTASQVTAPRVEPVPASCRDCTNASHCQSGNCMDGICMP